VTEPVLDQNAEEFLQNYIQQEHTLKLLMETAYSRLRMLARRERSKLPAGETLRTTALVNEAYIKLHQFAGKHELDRNRFFGLCATIMRRIIIDKARLKRELTMKPEHEYADISPTDDVDMLNLSDVLDQLAQRNPRAAQVVECRFFAGYTHTETAEILGVNEKTVRRDWLLAKAFLLTNMDPQSSS